MFGFAIDLVLYLLGVGLGIFALSLLVVFIRVLFYDNGAYEANRSVTPKNVFRIWSGNFDEGLDDKDNRTSQGLALNIKTGELEIQRRLSDEAVDDVIGRRV